MSVYQPPYNFLAVVDAYPEVVFVDDEKGAFDKDMNEIELDDEKVKASITKLNADASANLYQLERTSSINEDKPPYAPIGDQLDMLWHDIDSGKLGDTAKTGTWYLAVKKVKDNFPKDS